MRLFCFTFAGGGGSFFNGLDAYVRPEIELVKLEYAGHIERRREPFYSGFDELSRDMLGRVEALTAAEQPYALLGYSMGAIAAAEVTRMIVAGGLPRPAHVFLASHGPRPMRASLCSEGQDTDEAVKRWTIRFGGLPDKLIDSRTFWRIYLPIYHADYELITRYDFRRLDFTTDIPATALFSPEDISRGDIERWRNVFTGDCEIVEYSGGHFFLRGHEQEVAELIKRRLSLHDV